MLLFILLPYFGHGDIMYMTLSGVVPSDMDANIIHEFIRVRSVSTRRYLLVSLHTNSSTLIIYLLHRIQANWFTGLNLACGGPSWWQMGFLIF